MKLKCINRPEQIVVDVAGFVVDHAVTLHAIVVFSLLILSCAVPTFAFAQSSSGTLAASAQTAVNYIKTGVYFILIVAVLGSAVAAAFGRMEWATVGRVLIGCVVAGMATEVVDGLSNLKGQ